MHNKPDTQHAAARRMRKDAALDRATLLANSAIETCLESLSTADKNRFLLALHAQIGEQLESLAEDTHQ